MYSNRPSSADSLRGSDSNHCSTKARRARSSPSCRRHIAATCLRPRSIRARCESPCFFSKRFASSRSSPLCGQPGNVRDPSWRSLGVTAPSRASGGSVALGGFNETQAASRTAGRVFLIGGGF